MILLLVEDFLITIIALSRWRVGHGRLTSLLLIAIGILSFWFILSIR
jgi:hypothetical protein